ncbi:hypothetical protein BC831DRAFT_486087 [Entophlyctis helioformis]|nr:hypothetical protein BC831DRAFT_486087 [Entophlyctis helioformis]
MREASDILNTPAAMQIRYLETLSMMARTTGAKVIFMPGADSSSIKGAAGGSPSAKGGNGGGGSSGLTMRDAMLLEQML